MKGAGISCAFLFLSDMVCLSPLFWRDFFEEARKIFAVFAVRLLRFSHVRAPLWSMCFYVYADVGHKP